MIGSGEKGRRLGRGIIAGIARGWWATGAHFASLDNQAREAMLRAVIDLRNDLEGLEGWPNVYLHGPLLIHDLMHALGFPERQIDFVLGVEGASEVELRVSEGFRCTDGAF